LNTRLLANEALYRLSYGAFSERGR